MNYLVRDRAVIFNLAGQVSHIDSMRDPYTDLEINCRSQLTVLEACRNHNPGVKVVFAGTRQVYGRPDSLPVDESQLVRPTDVNGINKAAGEYYHLVYNNVFGVRACSLRLTNVYGPRQLIKHNRQGFIGWFIRLAIEDRPIQIYGDGSQLRDFVYVDDAADAFLRAGADDRCNGEVFNVGGDDAGQPSRADDAARRDRRDPGRVEYVDWPADEEGDRHRQLLRRLDEVQADDRLGAARARSPTACATPSRSTARTSSEYVGAGGGSARDAAAHSVHDARAARRRGRSPRRDRSRRRARLVRARARGRGVRIRVRRGDGRRLRASASATAPTRSR